MCYTRYFYECGHNRTFNSKCRHSISRRFVQHVAARKCSEDRELRRRGQCRRCDPERVTKHKRGGRGGEPVEDDDVQDGEEDVENHEGEDDEKEDEEEEDEERKHKRDKKKGKKEKKKEKKPADKKAKDKKSKDKKSSRGRDKGAGKDSSSDYTGEFDPEYETRQRNCIDAWLKMVEEADVESEERSQEEAVPSDCDDSCSDSSDVSDRDFLYPAARDNITPEGVDDSGYTSDHHERQQPTDPPQRPTSAYLPARAGWTKKPPPHARPPSVSETSFPPPRPPNSIYATDTEQKPVPPLPASSDHSAATERQVPPPRPANSIYATDPEKEAPPPRPASSVYSTGTSRQAPPPPAASSVYSTATERQVPPPRPENSIYATEPEYQAPPRPAASSVYSTSTTRQAAPRPASSVYSTSTARQAPPRPASSVYSTSTARQAPPRPASSVYSTATAQQAPAGTAYSVANESSAYETEYAVSEAEAAGRMPTITEDNAPQSDSPYVHPTINYRRIPPTAGESRFANLPATVSEAAAQEEKIVRSERRVEAEEKKWREDNAELIREQEAFRESMERWKEEQRLEREEQQRRERKERRSIEMTARREHEDDGEHRSSRHGSRKDSHRSDHRHSERSRHSSSRQSQDKGPSRHHSHGSRPRRSRHENDRIDRFSQERPQGWWDGHNNQPGPKITPSTAGSERWQNPRSAPLPPMHENSDDNETTVSDFLPRTTQEGHGEEMYRVSPDIMKANWGSTVGPPRGKRSDKPAQPEPRSALHELGHMGKDLLGKLQHRHAPPESEMSFACVDAKRVSSEHRRH